MNIKKLTLIALSIIICSSTVKHSYADENSTYENGNVSIKNSISKKIYQDFNIFSESSNSDYIYNSHIQDLKFLLEQLDKNHPDFDRKPYEILISKNADKIIQMDDTQFNFEVCRILASMKDAHTYANIAERDCDRMIPIWQIKHYSDGWYIDGIHKSSADYVGYKIVEIGDIPIEKIKQMAKPYISYEAEGRLNYYFSEAIKNSALFKYLGVVKDDKVIPITLDDNGKLFKAEIQTFPLNDYEQYNYGTWITFPPTGQYSGYNYFMQDLDDTTLFIQYAYCYERDDCTVSEFIEQITDKLKEEKYKNVIFDLRYNTGGMFSLFEPVVDEIGKYKQQQNFNLYCLIDENTFSTGVMHAVQLKNYGAILVGRPTGGIVNFYANTVNFKLPNSKIPVSCSTYYNKTVNDYTSMSLEPDIPVECFHKDIINGIDSDVQTILNLP